MDEEPQSDQEPPSSPVSVAIIISKQHMDKALEFSTTVHGDSFYIDNVAFIPSASLANDQTAEGDWIRRYLFIIYLSN